MIRGYGTFWKTETMTHRIRRVRDYEFTSEDRLFLDANIWLCIFCPDAQKPSPQIEAYSRAFNDICNVKSRLYIDVLVISEFINTYARLRLKHEAPEMKFKAFRNSPLFKSVAREIAVQSGRVLNCCARVESGFEGLPINDLLHDYGMGRFDFNDQVIAELCKREGLTLVTHDGDFKYQGLSILTENPRLLK